MGLIYEEMDRTKEAIQRTFNDNKEKYKDTLKRWGCQLHHPLHAEIYYLNPRFYYTNPNNDKDDEVEDELSKCIDKISKDDEFVVEVHKELLMYKRSGERFGITAT